MAQTMILMRHVIVDRTRSPQAMLKATRCEKHTNGNMASTISQGEGEEVVDVYFFQIGRSVNDDELEREYEQCGLKPADLYSLAAVNEVDSAFADDHPNGTHWQDAEGNWRFATFGRWDGGRRVNVDCNFGWHGNWWFAGLCRSA